MNNELFLLETIGQIQDNYIVAAHRQQTKMSGRRYLLIAAIAAVLLLLAGCAFAAWHWYAEFFTMRRQEPLSPSQVDYINQNAQMLNQSQTIDGYTIELKSAISEKQTAYLTFALTAPENVDLSNLLKDDRLSFANLYVRPVGSKLPADLSCSVLDDGDGKNNTINIVLTVLPGGLLSEDASFGSGNQWQIVMQGPAITVYDREYEEELMRTKYAGVTEYMLEDEEAARLYTDMPLSDGRWEFTAELTFADLETLELLNEPIMTKVLVTRKDRTDTMFFETADAMEEICITSIRLHSLGATVQFDPPEPVENSDFPNYFCAWMDLGDMYNPLTELTNPADNFFLILKDGTRIDFWQMDGALDTAELTSDSPVVLSEISYLQLSDGTKIYISAS